MRIKIKSFLGVLLSFVMVALMLPDMGVKAFGYDNNPYEGLVPTNEDAYGSEALANKKVTFGGHEWYVIKDESTSPTEGTLTLFAVECFMAAPFNPKNSDYNDYSLSAIRTTTLPGILTSDEGLKEVSDAIKAVKLTTYRHNSDSEVHNETDGSDKLWLLSKSEATALPQGVLKCPNPTTVNAVGNMWWLRSPGSSWENADDVYFYNEQAYISEYGGEVESNYGVRPALQLDLSKVTFSSEFKKFSLKAATYSVTLEGGANAVTSGGSTSQNSITGAMETVTYTAKNRYHFEEFTDIIKDGVTVKRTGKTTVTVSGIPIDNVKIKVPDAVKDEGAYNSYLVKPSDTAATLAGKTVSFGGHEWYVIIDDSSDLKKGTLTLFAVECLSVSHFNPLGADNNYSTSDIRNNLADLFASDEGLRKAGGAINPVTVKTYKYDSESEIHNITDGSDKLWLLSRSEAEVLPEDVRKCTDVSPGTSLNFWWLRSPGSEDFLAIAVSCEDGVIDNNGMNSTFGVRPALELDLSAVSFDPESKSFTIDNWSGYNVTLKGGENAVTSGGSVNQTGLTGAMKTVTYTAKDGYHFDKFDDIKDRGILVKWTGASAYIVSGTPLDNVTLTVPDAVKDPDTCSVTVKIGGNAAASGGSVNQTGLKGAMETVIITAKEGYHFEEFKDIEDNGILVKRTGIVTVTVSGSPTKDVIITVPDAVKEAEGKSFEYFLVSPTDTDSALADKKVSFAGHDWYVIKDNSKSRSEGTLTLFSAEYFGESSYNLVGSNNDYSRSLVRTALAEILASDEGLKKAGSAINAIPVITYDCGSDSIVNNITDGSDKLWLLSTSEAEALPVDLLKCSDTIQLATNKWWLRTPHEGDGFSDGSIRASYVSGETGAVFGRPFSHGAALNGKIDELFAVRPALQLDLSSVIFNPVSDKFTLKSGGYSVIIKGGVNAVSSGGSISQNGITGEMETVTFTAESGYCFEEFSAVSVNGITVERTGEKTVTVSGTPTADVTVAVPDAVTEPAAAKVLETEADKKDNKATDIRSETVGEFKITYAHQIAFPGKGKLTAESFGENFTVQEGDSTYKVKKIKINKKKLKIRITGLYDAPKDVVKKIKKATRGDNGVPYEQYPYNVKEGDKVTPKPKKDGSLKSVKVLINGKDYKAKNDEWKYDTDTKIITFEGNNLTGSYKVE